MADTSKAWFKSKGMWAGILTVTASAYVGVQSAFPSIHLPSIAQFSPLIFAVLGIFGIYGRIAADGKITFTDTK